MYTRGGVLHGFKCVPASGLAASADPRARRVRHVRSATSRAGRPMSGPTATPSLAGGEVRIVNTNGTIDVEGVEGADLEVRAERVARAATDTGAAELLPRISIKEDVTPDRVSIETERMSGIMIGASFEVDYHVRAPKNAVVTVTNTNGVIGLTALGGKGHRAGRPTAASTRRGSPAASRPARPTAASASTSRRPAPKRSRCTPRTAASR